MADVTLTIGSYTFTFNEGDVKKVTESIAGTADQQEIAGAGPMSAYVQDYDGVKKVIKVEGHLTVAASTRIPGYTITTIFQQKQWLESVLNGSQTQITFTSTYATQSILSAGAATPPYLGSFTSTKAKKGFITFYENEGDPSRLQFDATLLVGN